jgi:hypothetical protein
MGDSHPLRIGGRRSWIDYTGSRIGELEGNLLPDNRQLLSIDNSDFQRTQGLTDRAGLAVAIHLRQRDVLTAFTR